jgi:hypothetical protein
MLSDRKHANRVARLRKFHALKKRVPEVVVDKEVELIERAAAEIAGERDRAVALLREFDNSEFGGAFEDGDEEVNGGDLVDFTGRWLVKVRELLAEFRAWEEGRLDG